MDKDDALNTLAKVFHNGEEMEGEDGAVMVVDLALWNEGCEAIEELIGSVESDMDSVCHDIAPSPNAEITGSARSEV